MVDELRLELRDGALVALDENGNEIPVPLKEAVVSEVPDGDNAVVTRDLAEELGGPNVEIEAIDVENRLGETGKQPVDIELENTGGEGKAGIMVKVDDIVEDVEWVEFESGETKKHNYELSEYDHNEYVLTVETASDQETTDYAVLEPNFAYLGSDDSVHIECLVDDTGGIGLPWSPIGASGVGGNISLAHSEEIIAYGGNSEIRGYDAFEGTELSWSPISSYNDSTEFTFAINDQYLIVGVGDYGGLGSSNDGTVYVYDLDSGSEVSWSPVYDGDVIPSTVAINSQYLAYRSSGGIAVHDLSDGSEMSWSPVSGGTSTFDMSEEYILAGSNSNLIGYDLSDGSEVSWSSFGDYDGANKIAVNDGYIAFIDDSSLHVYELTGGDVSELPWSPTGNESSHIANGNVMMVTTEYVAYSNDETGRARIHVHDMSDGSEVSWSPVNISSNLGNIGVMW